MEVLILLVMFIALVLFQNYIFNKFASKNLLYECSFSQTEAIEGDNLYLCEAIQNRKLLPVPWLKVDIHSSRWLDFAEKNSVITQDNRRISSNFVVGSRKKLIRRWKVKCLKRGVYNIEKVTLIWGDLFGISDTSEAKSVNARLIVYPEPLNLENLLTPVNYIQGDTIVKRWIVDDPFYMSGIREYQPGDSIKRINWYATAKTGRILVRRNEFTSQLKMSVILNIQSDEFDYGRVINRDMIEFGIKIAAGLFERAGRMGIPAAFASNGFLFDEPDKCINTEFSSSKDHIGLLMTLLAKLQIQKMKDFDGFFSELEGYVCDSEIIVITSYINDYICNTARNMRNKGNIVKVYVLDAFIDAKNMPGDIDVYILSGAGEKKFDYEQN